MPTRKFAVALTLAFSCVLSTLAQTAAKPKLTLDEFFNSVSFPALELSPDGNSVLIAAERADWAQQIFRTDLWLYRDESKTLIQLTQSGHDSEPKWSPDGRWIAFLSERKSSTAKGGDSDDDKKDDAAQLYLISPNGGEAFPITEGSEEVHSFAWSADSQAIYFATRQPWTQSQKDSYKKEWKDVEQYRTAERGDTIFALNIADALARHTAAPAKDSTSKKNDKDEEDESDFTPGAIPFAKMSLRAEHLLVSPDGATLAILSNAINQRQEKYEDVEFYTIDLKGVKGTLTAATADPKKPAIQEAHLVEPRRLTKNEAYEIHPRWAADSHHIFFSVEVGDPFGPYRDLQPHLYWVDTASGKVEQWAKDFIGQIVTFEPTANGALVAARLGTEVQMYAVNGPADSLHAIAGQKGTYEDVSVSPHSQRIAFQYSTLTQPTEVYLADTSTSISSARAITQFNKIFTERDLPQGKPYQWKSDDGTSVEGMLIYPPGKFEAKHLPMLTLIHGGPADADGNHFEADWYQWAALAATHGWLVFEPNYRGSTGYGDKFLMQIVPQIVSRPGKDILTGVDALVKDGIADPDHLTIGGYSYGGYMTNWLITQTTRFKAAVTGAGAVEHIGNWGNDDTTYDDAYFLGGRPWEAAQRYHDEAALFQIDKVKTPTHMVAGADDIRVAVLEDYLLEHALYSLGIPNKLLVFPGEGHSLSKNPWHGKIKVREELKWLEQYGGIAASH